MVDEDEQPLSAFPVKLIPQFGLHNLGAESNNNKQLFLNIAPMTFDESHRKSRDRISTKASITTMVSHFRLLRTMDNEEVFLDIPTALFQSNENFLL